MVTIENRVMAKPFWIMWLILRCPLANTMAFGGVATGIMKAQLAASAVGIASNTGETPMDTASAPISGRKVAAVAVLLVISVSRLMEATTTPTSNRAGSTPMPSK